MANVREESTMSHDDIDIAQVFVEYLASEWSKEEELPLGNSQWNTDYAGSEAYRLTLELGGKSFEEEFSAKQLVDCLNDPKRYDEIGRKLRSLFTKARQAGVGVTVPATVTNL